MLPATATPDRGECAIRRVVKGEFRRREASQATFCSAYCSTRSSIYSWTYHRRAKQTDKDVQQRRAPPNRGTPACHLEIPAAGARTLPSTTRREAWVPPPAAGGTRVDSPTLGGARAATHPESRGIFLLPRPGERMTRCTVPLTCRWRRTKRRMRGPPGWQRNTTEKGDEPRAAR